MVIPLQPLLVLYGSETGNAQDVAERIAREAQRRHFTARAVPMDSYNVMEFPSERLVLFVASTTGQGDPPGNMRKFWKFLLKKGLPPDSLIGMTVAVFGLGDSGYQKFNVTAKKLEARLLQLGASRLLEKGLGDDQARCGYYRALDPWLQRLWKELRSMYPLPPGVSEPAPDDQGTGQLGKPKYKVTYLTEEATAEPISSQASTGTHSLPEDTVRALRAATAFRQVANAASGVIQPATQPGTFSHSRPLGARVLRNTRLTDPEHFQDVRHIELDISGSGEQYEPGDVLSVAPVVSNKDADAFLERCSLDGNALVQVGANSVPDGSKGFTAKVRLRDLIRGAMDVAGSSPRRYFFEVAKHFASEEHEHERLEYFASPEGADDLYTYNQKEHRSFLEALDDFKSVQLPLEWLLELVPALQPRQFSISSSHAMHPGRAHITVAVVSYKTPYKRAKVGLCSSWLGSLDPEQGSVHVPAWLQKGSMRMPQSLGVPIIMVGPGTGVAPFRSFLQERYCALLSQGEHQVAPAVLFFGCRSQRGDYLYRSEFEAMCSAGVLDRGHGLNVAFSRDQAQKRYVQHCIEEEGAFLWDLLSQKAAVVYVAGSANKMPEDVASAFKKVAQMHGGLSESDAATWLRHLEVSRRYHVETWS